MDLAFIQTIFGENSHADSEWIGPTVGKLAMDAFGYVIEDLGFELDQQLWWAVGALAAVHMVA